VSGGAAGTGGTTTTATKTYVYLGSGSWEGGGSGKLQVYAFDQESAALSPVQELPVGDLNSFAAIDPNGKYLYATDEVGLKARSYAINPADGRLSFVNEIDTSDGAVFSTLDATGKYLLVAYYGAGSVEVFSLGADGTIGASVDSEATGSQAHSVTLSPDNQFAFVPNKGNDDVSQFTFDASSGALTANAQPAVSSGGDGPRHMAFHPSGSYAYLLNETDSLLTAFNFSATAGNLAPLETLANVPDGTGGKASSDVHVTADGKFLYATNRDDSNTIAMFSIGSDGKLTSLGHEPAQGQTPRNFAIHPTSNVLLVANQESSTVATFRIQADGRLEFIESTPVNAAVFWVGLLLLPQ
jgi:6-phosphogluconolactonase